MLINSNCWLRCRMMSVARPLLLCLFSALVEVHSQTVPYVSFMGTNLTNHSYMDLNQVGNTEGGSDSVQCHTDLSTCCSSTQGDDRGDWYFPNGDRLRFAHGPHDIYEYPRAQRVDVNRRNNGDTSGLYRCTIETIAVSGNDSSAGEVVYVGLYASGGECTDGKSVTAVSAKCVSKFATGDVTISGNMTFTEDSDLSGESPQFTLTCTSTGGPATTVTWTRDSDTVSGGMTVLDDPVTAQYTHTLTVTERLGGQYQCNVSNNKPSIATAQFTVASKCITGGGSKNIWWGRNM